MGKEQTEVDVSTTPMADVAQPVMTVPTPMEVEMPMTDAERLGP
jgi:hypothetical protein